MAALTLAMLVAARITGIEDRRVEMRSVLKCMMITKDESPKFLSVVFFVEDDRLLCADGFARSARMDR